jgi:hypothetical protein
MLTETLLKIPFSVIGRYSKVSTPHCWRDNVRELICYRRLPVCIFSVKIEALGPLKGVTERIFEINR